MKKYIFALVIGACFLASCQKDDQPAPPPAVPASFGFTETGETISISVNEGWKFEIFNVASISVEVVCDSARTRFHGGGFEFGSVTDPNGKVNRTKNLCEQRYNSTTVDILLKKQGDPIVTGTPAGCTGKVDLKSPALNSWGAKTGRIAGVPVVLWPAYTWDGQNDTYIISHWLMGFK